MLSHVYLTPSIFLLYLLNSSSFLKQRLITPAPPTSQLHRSLFPALNELSAVLTGSRGARSRPRIEVRLRVSGLHEIRPSYPFPSGGDRGGGCYVLQEDIYWTFIVLAVPRLCQIDGLRDS